MRIREMLILENNALQQVLALAQADLANAPEGTLCLSRSHGTPQYRRYNKDGRRPYLSKDSTEIMQLAQKDYATKVVAYAKKEITRIGRLLLSYPAANQRPGNQQREPRNPTVKQRIQRGGAQAKGVPAASCLLSQGSIPLQQKPQAELQGIKAIYSNLPQERQLLVTPYIEPDEVYAQRWESAQYESRLSKEGCIYSTAKGDKVRSKSEVIIANRLFEKGIPYRYEQPLLVGTIGPLHPDFIILNRNTRQEIIWEHLGMMDDPVYCEKALKRLNLYASQGITAHNGLITTSESASVPLDLSTVDALIEPIAQ